VEPHDLCTALRLERSRTPRGRDCWIRLGKEKEEKGEKQEKEEKRSTSEKRKEFDQTTGIDRQQNAHGERMGAHAEVWALESAKKSASS
jgi:hypothetical protein